MTRANEVDHINGDPWDNRRENLQPLCPPCHSRKTVAEQGGFGNPAAAQAGGEDQGKISIA